MKTRDQLIAEFKLWRVERRGVMLFEGSKTACLRFMRENGLYRTWKRGGSDISLGKIISEGKASA